MTTYDAVLALPTEDRGRAYAFYGADGLGFETPGGLADDGVPEPLQVVVNAGLRLMLVPTGGFGWLTSGRETAGRDSAECLLSATLASPEEVDAFLAKAIAAGAQLATPAQQQPWGYRGSFADPDGHLWEAVAPA